MKSACLRIALRMTTMVFHEASPVSLSFCTCNLTRDNSIGYARPKNYHVFVSPSKQNGGASAVHLGRPRHTGPWQTP